MIFVVLEELCMHKNRNKEYRHVFYISLVYQLPDKVSELFLLHDFLGNYFQMFLSEYQIFNGPIDHCQMAFRGEKLETNLGQKISKNDQF